MVTIWFESHATTIDNEAKIASGWIDVDLSETGLEQAEELVPRSKERAIDAIFCSDLQRAVKTAIPTSNEMHIPIYADARLRECNYGEWEHKDNALVTKEKPNRINKPFPGGESYQQCMDRMKSFYEWLKSEFDGKTVMIIGHRATHYGVEHFVLGKSVVDCMDENWKWQPGWKYELK